MTDTAVPATNNGKNILSTEEVVANGDGVTTITKTKTVRKEYLINLITFF